LAGFRRLLPRGLRPWVALLVSVGVVVMAGSADQLVDDADSDPLD
jgi:hypothetical protein